MLRLALRQRLCFVFEMTVLTNLLIWAVSGVCKKRRKALDEIELTRMLPRLEQALVAGLQITGNIGSMG